MNSCAYKGITRQRKKIYYWKFQCNGLTAHVASSHIGAVRVKISFSEVKNFISKLETLAPGAKFFEDFNPNEALVATLRAYLNGENPPMNLPWDIHATAFRYSVWKGICSIPYGETRSYKEVAFMVSKPNGARAVGQALNKNPLMILIPCHRVVSVSSIGGFGSGIDLKRYLLNLEQGRKAL